MSVTKVKRTALKSLSRAVGRACRLLGERRVAAVFRDWFRADPAYAQSLLTVCLRTMPHMPSLDDRTLIDLLRLRADGQDRPFDASRPIDQQHVAAVFRDWFRADPDHARGLLSACLGTMPDTVPLQDRTLIDLLRLRADGQDSPFYSHHVYSEMAGCARRHGHETARVLEIGPGSSLGALTCFLAAGSERAAGADIEPLHGDRATYYEDLKRYLAVVEGFRWWRSSASTDSDPKHSYPACWDHVDLSALATQINYRAPAPSHSLPFPDSCFDFIYSVAVLEHVEDAAGTIAELRRVLEPGGLTTHEIDLRYHGPNDLLKLLRWPEDEYRAMTQRYGEGRGIDSILDGTWKGEVYCNRLRLSDWLELFRGHNFEILEVEPLCVIAEDQLCREELCTPFDSKSSEDLAVVQVRITAHPTGDGSASSVENGV